MKEVEFVLTESLKKTHQTKLQTLAERTPRSELSAFTNVFKVTPLINAESELLELLLEENDEAKGNLEADLLKLKQLTAEVKAINTQAVILHGERIKQAQTILKNYKEGAFTTWLIQTYGNRQTPYNFLQYYEFYQTLPESLKQKLLGMPRQAAYALASRKGDVKAKEHLIEEYQSQTKEALLAKIRDTFPLSLSDKRRQNAADKCIQTLTKLATELKKEEILFSKYETEKILSLLKEIKEIL